MVNTLVCVVVTGILACVNASSRINDAVRIVSPEPGERQDRLFALALRAFYVCAAISAIGALIAALIIGGSVNILIFIFIVFFGVMLLLNLIIIRFSFLPTGRLSPLLTDLLAIRMGEHFHIDKDKSVLCFRIFLTMVKIFVFFYAVATLFTQ